MDVDILISGHTHELQLWESDTKIFINPGSATGAYSGFNLYALPAFHSTQGSTCDAHVVSSFRCLPLQTCVLTLPILRFSSDATPSFVLMDISDASVVVFIYKLVDEKLKVEKIKYEPKQASA